MAENGTVEYALGEQRLAQPFNVRPTLRSARQMIDVLRVLD